MREILFRGKRKDNGKWVEGFVHCVTDNYTAKNCWYITTFKKLDNEEIVLTGQYEVIPETVGQYTGLPDENGTKIFEGDIVYILKQDESAEIAWDKDLARYIISSANMIADFDNFWNFEMEVIGNIYDNPELLEVE